MHTHNPSKPTNHFGPERAAVYDAQAAKTTAGHSGMYELVAAALAVEVTKPGASLLFVGIGTGTELLPVVNYGAPGWHFTGVDPSADMLAVAERRVATEGLGARTRLHACELHALPPGPPFDGASMIGVLKQAHLVSPHLLFAAAQFKVFLTRYDPAAAE